MIVLLSYLLVNLTKYGNTIWWFNIKPDKIYAISNVCMHMNNIDFNINFEGTYKPTIFSNE